jgi:hypothetical protein
MTARIWLALPLLGVVLIPALWAPRMSACAPCPPPGKPVVNADQTVIIIWDANTKTEHFIRKASFKSDADDFGFLVPTPNQPELNESGNEAFPYLLKLTEPEIKKVPRPSGGMGCGCGVAEMPKQAAGRANDKGEPAVHVLETKEVAGFNAVVLETKSARALIDWLKEHGYAYSPEIEAWAKPYVEGGWKITALKVAKGKGEEHDKTVAAGALRMTFKTDRPLFPYREPDSRSPAEALGARHRLLRIYFLADARYQGDLTKEVPWTGRVAWSDKLKAEDRQRTLDLLKLPQTSGPADWWLTEFEDDWPYQVAPADVYFAQDRNQGTVKREPIIEYVTASGSTDLMACTLAAVLVLPPVLRRIGRRRKG